MKRSRIIFFASFVLALCAGAVLGALWTKLPAARGTPVSPDKAKQPSWIVDQLHLRPDQARQFEGVWADMHQNMGKSFEKRHALEKERDEAIKALLTDEQTAIADKIRQDYIPKIGEANHDRERLLQEADARSRSLLDADQQKRWDELTKQRDHHRGPGDHGPGDRSRGPGRSGSRSATQGTRATTQQSAQSPLPAVNPDRSKP